jgi:hypothetical protein
MRISVALIMSVTVLFIVSMSFIMTVSVLFMDLFISLEHRNDMRHWSMSECCEVEMYDHESAEENPEEDMDQVNYLYSSNEIDSRSVRP